MFGEEGWIDVDLAVGKPIRAVGTLGPVGTSSEQASLYLRASRCESGSTAVRLYATYEAAGEALRHGIVSHLVVANAYAGVNGFYMDPALSFAGAFLFDTPHYGLAASRGYLVPRQARVATHPAPAALVDELMPERYSVAQLRFTDSTSAAAIYARDRETDLALTTQPAAEQHALEFISRTRTIRMLWSVFTARTDAGRGQA